MKKITMTLALGAAMLAGGQAVQAAPVAPSQASLQSAWLFDDTVGTQGNAGYGTPDSQGVGPALQASETTTLPNNNLEIPLVAPGDPVKVNGGGTTTNYSATPFNYAGNKSVLADWSLPVTGQQDYPDDRRTIGVRDVSYSMGAEGAVSFWYNPIYHPPHGPGESYLFAIRSSATGDRLVAGIYTNENGDPTPGFVTNASGTGGLQISDWGIDYSGLDNGSPSNEWYNILVTWGAGGLQAYVDGTLVATDAAFVQNAFTADLIYVGAYTNIASHAPGLYDEFAIWNSQLNADNAEWLASNSLNALQVTAVVPEPATAALGLMGLGGLLVASRRRRAC